MQTLADTCFDQRYPKILGGTEGITSFNAIDMDDEGNFIIGGSSSDPTVTGVSTIQIPILMYIYNGGLYKWSISLQNTFNAYKGIGAVKYSKE